MAKSTKLLYEIHEELEKREKNFVSDTTTAAGKAIFGMIAVIAEFERNL